MAVPKKRTSKSKTRSRKAVWKRQAFHESLKAVSLAKSSAAMKGNGFVHVLRGQED